MFVEDLHGLPSNPITNAVTLIRGELEMYLVSFISICRMKRLKRRAYSAKDAGVAIVNHSLLQARIPPGDNPNIVKSDITA